MRSRLPLLLSMTILVFPAFALDPDSNPTWILQGQVESSNMWGTPLTSDRELYRAMGLTVHSNDGSTVESIQPSYSGFALGAGLWRWIDSSWQVGLDLHAGWELTEHSSTLVSTPVLALSQQQLVAGVRWLPIALPMAKMIRLGVQGGAGFSMGTLHRYAIAADNLGAWTESVRAQETSENSSNMELSIQTFQHFATTGNQDLSLLGWLWQAQLRGQAERQGIFLAFHLGLQGEQLKPQNDPLAGEYIYSTATGVTTYSVPDSYSTLELLFGIELGARF